MLLKRATFSFFTFFFSQNWTLYTLWSVAKASTSYRNCQENSGGFFSVNFLNKIQVGFYQRSCGKIAKMQILRESSGICAKSSFQGDEESSKLRKYMLQLTEPKMSSAFLLHFPVHISMRVNHQGLMLQRLWELKKYNIIQTAYFFLSILWHWDVPWCLDKVNVGIMEVDRWGITKAACTSCCPH